MTCARLPGCGSSRGYQTPRGAAFRADKQRPARVILGNDNRPNSVLWERHPLRAPFDSPKSTCSAGTRAGAESCPPGTVLQSPSRNSSSSSACRELEVVSPDAYAVEETPRRRPESTVRSVVTPLPIPSDYQLTLERLEMAREIKALQDLHQLLDIRHTCSSPCSMCLERLRDSLGGDRDVLCPPPLPGVERSDWGQPPTWFEHLRVVAAKDEERVQERTKLLNEVRRLTQANRQLRKSAGDHYHEEVARMEAAVTDLKQKLQVTEEDSERLREQVLEAQLVQKAPSSRMSVMNPFDRRGSAGMARASIRHSSLLALAVRRMSSGGMGIGTSGRSSILSDNNRLGVPGLPGERDGTLDELAVAETHMTERRPSLDPQGALTPSEAADDEAGLAHFSEESKESNPSLEFPRGLAYASFWGIDLEQLIIFYKEVVDPLEVYANCHEYIEEEGTRVHICRLPGCTCDHRSAEHRGSAPIGVQESHLSADIDLLVTREVMPRTEESGVSWALMVNPDGLKGRVFVSHCWSDEFRNLVGSLQKALEEMDTMWISCFALDQNTASVTDHLDLRERSGYLALQGATKHIVAFDQAMQVVQRAWCMFEVATAVQLDIPVGVWFCKISDDFNDVLEKVKAFDVANVQASDPSDIERIHALIKLEDGGFDPFNRRISEAILERLDFHCNMLQQDGYVLSREHKDDHCEQELQEQRVLVKIQEQELMRAQNEVERQIEVARIKNQLDVIDDLYQMSIQHSVQLATIQEHKASLDKELIVALTSALVERDEELSDLRSQTSKLKRQMTMNDREVSAREKMVDKKQKELTKTENDNKEFDENTQDELKWAQAQVAMYKYVADAHKRRPTLHPGARTIATADSDDEEVSPGVTPPFSPARPRTQTQ